MSQQLKAPSRSHAPHFDRAHDSYDHAINLVDTTQSTETNNDASSREHSPGGKKLGREPTRVSVRETLHRRKYAKWQQDRYDTKDGEVQEQEVDEDSEREARPKALHHAASEAQDFAHNGEVDTPSKPKKLKKPRDKSKAWKKNNQEYAIDILYENQRGSFFCGIPLYSHSSLLNFDPAPWVTKEFKDSAVNITNAQVPDPSWQWDWKHWYVDMSGDVDEDGWQYSFAFFGNFAWHGTHPWFHSYVRRRRWLRRRVKKDKIQPGKALPSSMSQAHKLNTDYFTIHSKRTRSPGRAGDNGSQTAPRPESYVSYKNFQNFEDEIPDEIKDIASLLKALRLSSVDREKIDVVKKFIDSGGEELVYLAEQIPNIMSLLMFQNSKRQLLEFMKERTDDAQKHRDEHDAEDRPEGEVEARRINNLLKAVEAANKQIDGLEYWSDRKHVLKINEDPNPHMNTTLKTIFDEPAASPRPEDHPAAGIRGISDEAEVGFDGTQEVAHRVHTADKRKAEAEDKGKGKSTEEEDQDAKENGARLSPRLKQDQMFIQDDNA